MAGNMGRDTLYSVLLRVLNNHSYASEVSAPSARG